jgi:hypothetical protein
MSIEAISADERRFWPSHATFDLCWKMPASSEESIIMLISTRYEVDMKFVLSKKSPSAMICFGQKRVCFGRRCLAIVPIRTTTELWQDQVGS